jgi:predicted DsbA family dithiol-disulfide isomerase
MLIEIFADFACPWCFVGRRRLARALGMRPLLEAQIVWQPFQLNPELPPQGMDRALYLQTRFGDRTQFHVMEAALAESSRRDGIRFAFDRVGRVPNTLAAHRLMRFAAPFLKDDPLADALFSAYFEEGSDIGDRETLVDCAARVGLDPDQARRFLDSGAERSAVLLADERARQGGIAGVPYFIFDRRYAMAGAQEAIAFLPLFDALAESEAALLASGA